MPRDAAHRLVGAIAHPLNRAVIDTETNTVVEGYGILQPRVDISIHSANRSRFAAIFSSDAGFDIYARAVSDVYQDLFGEGSFTGKGIYEVSVFQQVLEHRFPCNMILSHDMIEGAYARAGLVSDIEVVDDYPTKISAFTRRKHRWIRGDWQIIFWLLPRVPNFFGKTERNPLSVISRWKILDNLRRSLTEIATFVMLLCGLDVPAWQGAVLDAGNARRPGAADVLPVCDVAPARRQGAIHARISGGTSRRTSESRWRICSCASPTYATRAS